MEIFENIDNPRDIRKKLGLNQHDFWQVIGITQSGGSRYESGRKMPKVVRALLRIVHIEKINLNDINAIDLLIAKRLKAENSDLYKKLKISAKKEFGAV